MKYNEALKTIEVLIKKGELQSALELALKVRQAYPSDQYLHKVIMRIKKGMRTTELEQRGGFVKNAIKTIKRFKREKNYEDAVKACKELLSYDPDNNKAKKLLRKCSIAFINKKLKDPLKKQWAVQGDYENLYVFYQKLHKVFPDYPKLKKLIRKTEKKMLEKDRENKKAFANESLAKLQAMFDDGKFEKVIEGAEELIAFTHFGSKELKKLLEKARRKNWKEIEHDTYEYMTKQEPILAEAYASKSEPMIKI